MKTFNCIFSTIMLVVILGTTATTYAVVPDAVQSLRSVSHVVNTPSQNGIIKMSWRPPENTSEIRGYYTTFNSNQLFVFNEENTLTIQPIDALEIVSTDYGEVDDISVYFHIAATSTEDEIGETSSFGPIRIDTKGPTNPILVTSQYSTSRIITLILGANNAIEMYLSNTAHGVGGQWEPLVSPKIWELTEGQGLKTIYVQFRDRADNRTKAMNTLNLDTIPPSVSISSQSAQETNETEITIDILFSEPVTDLVASDIFVNNCQVDTLTGENDRYTLKIIPVGAGELSIQIPDNKAVDVAGNGNEPSDTLIRIYDPVAPQVSVSSITPEYTREPAISATVSFSEPIKSFDAQSIQKVNVSEITSFSHTGNDYFMTLIPANQGPVEIVIPENVSFDTAGNGNTMSETLVRYYDSVSPSIAITSSTRETTNISPIPITITFDEKVKGFESTDVVTYGSVKNFFSLDMDNSYAQIFTFDLIPPGEGEVSVQIAENAAIDLAGNGNQAAEPFVRIYDLTQPDILITTEMADMTNQSSIACKATFTTPVENLEPNDIILTNATLQGDIVGTETIFSFNISPQSEGLVTILIPEDTVFSKSGNTNRKSNELQLTYDIQPPTFELQTIANQASNQSPIPVTLVCNELITGLNSADIQTQGVSDVVNFSVNGSIASFQLIPAEPGLLTVLVQTDAFTDPAGNANVTSQMIQIDFDIVAPTVVLASSTSEQVAESPIPVSVVFSEPVENFTLSDLSITNGVASNLQHIDPLANFTQTFTLNLVPGAQGDVTLLIQSGVAMDRAGNTNVSSLELHRTYASDRPTVTLSSSSPETTDISPIPLNIQFSTDVTGFDALDIYVTNAVVDQFEGVLSSYSCVLKPDKQGLITVDIPADVAQDSASLGNVAAAQLVRNFDYNDAPIAFDGSLSFDEDTSGTYTLKATDLDESDNLTYTLTTQPQGDLIFNNKTGELTYTPEPDYSGQQILTFVAGDSMAESNAASVTITVLPVNDPPMIDSSLMDQTILEDSLFEYSLVSVFVDIDENDSLSYTARQTNSQELPSWLIFDPSGLTFSGTPTNSDIGQIHIKVKATDLYDTSISDSFSLTIVNVNDLPEIDIHSSIEMNENKIAKTQFSVSDIDSAALSLYATTDNAGLIAYTGVTFSGLGLIYNEDETWSILPGPSGEAQLSMTVAPQPNQFGMGQITLWLSDEYASISSVVSVNIQAVRFSVSGTVSYFKNTYPMSRADVILRGNEDYNAVTDEYGHYTFTNVPAGDYSVEVSRNPDTMDESVSPMDASLIARSIVRLHDLDCYQLIAADVSLNADTSSMDTSLVARYSAGLITELNPDNVHWTFINGPIDNCSHWSVPINDYDIDYQSTHTIVDLQSDQSDIDFIGVRLGDVTGNWPDNHMRKRRKRDAESDPILIPTMIGETLQIPVVLSKPYTVQGLEILINFNQDKVRLVNADTSQTELIDYELTPNMNEKNSAWFGFHATPSVQLDPKSGNVMILTFEVLSQPPGTTPVSIQKFRINENMDEIVQGGFSYNDQVSDVFNVCVNPDSQTTINLIHAIQEFQKLSSGDTKDLLHLIKILKICSGMRQ